MKKIFIKSGSAKNSAKVVAELPVANIMGILLTLEGTTDAGQTLTKDDICTMQLLRNGRTLQDEDFSLYFDYTDLKNGFNLATLPTAGASEISAVIPMALPSFPNVLQVKDINEAVLRLNFKAILDTRFGANAANYRLDALVADDVYESYELNVLSQDFQFAGAGTLSNPLAFRNVHSLFIKDGDDILDELTYDVDGETVEQNAPIIVLSAITNLINQIESTGLDYYEIRVAESGIVESMFNTTNKLQIKATGNGVVDVIGFSADFSNSNWRANAQAVEARMNAKRNKLQQNPNSQLPKVASR